MLSRLLRLSGPRCRSTAHSRTKICSKLQTYMHYNTDADFLRFWPRWVRLQYLIDFVWICWILSGHLQYSHENAPWLIHAPIRSAYLQSASRLFWLLDSLHRQISPQRVKWNDGGKTVKRGEDIRSAEDRDLKKISSRTADLGCRYLANVALPTDADGDEVQMTKGSSLTCSLCLEQKVAHLTGDKPPSPIHSHSFPLTPGS